MSNEEAGDFIAWLEKEMDGQIADGTKELLIADFQLLDAEYLTAESGIFNPVWDDAPDSPFVFQKITQRIVFTSLGFIIAGIACAVASSVIKTVFG